MSRVAHQIVYYGLMFFGGWIACLAAHDVVPHERLLTAQQRALSNVTGIFADCEAHLQDGP